MDAQSQSGASRDSLFQRACRHAKDKKTAAARAEFSKVISTCACTRGLKRSPCKCKDYRRAALAIPPTVFDEAMYKCKCEMGKTFQKCDDDLHIKSLDYTVVTLMSDKKYSQAMETAGWLLEIAPRRFEGYLRMGQLAMRNRQYAFAWGLYCACVAMARKNHLESNPKFTALLELREPLHYKYCRVNPLDVLPFELNLAILEYLTASDWFRLSKTSKQWRSSVINNHRLWRNIVLNSAPRKMKSDAYSQLIRYSGGRIESLRCERPIYFSDGIYDLLVKCGASLKHLHLPLMSIKRNDVLLHNLKFSANFAPALETASFVCPLFEAGLCVMTLLPGGIFQGIGPNLRKLRLHYAFPPPVSISEHPLDNLRSLMVKHKSLNLSTIRNFLERPRLKQLCIYAPFRESLTPDPPSEPQCRLEDVVLDMPCCERFTDVLYLMLYGCMVKAMGTMRVLRQRHPTDMDTYLNNCTTFFQHLVTLDELYDLNLERVSEIGILDARSLNCTASRAVMQLSKAFKAGCVRCVSVILRLSSRPGDGMSLYRTTCVWGASSIVCLVLSLDQFHGDESNNNNALTEHDPDLVPFVESFASLQTLVLRDPYANMSSRRGIEGLVESLLTSASPATKVYLEGISGAPLDHMMRVAGERGREIELISPHFDDEHLKRTVWRTEDEFFPSPIGPGEPTIYG